MQIPEVARTLADFVDSVSSRGPKDGVEEFLYYGVDYEHAGESAGILINLLGGKKELQLLAKTIAQLEYIADNKGYRLDLHQGNFMLGSDGEIVINDPFWTGSYR
jgi:hypothetical protein